jgi:protein-S-isoprenylcysteine O-methyltransferase Ste14
MSHSDTAGVIAPPPLIFFGVELFGFSLNWLAPARFLPESLPGWVGLPLMVIGLLLGFSALGAMRQARTAVDPYEPATAVVTTGPYRFTRNPIYLGFTLIYLGLASLFNALFAVLFLPVALFVVDRYVIQREERYLERKFGETYLQYKAKVRRWL